MTQATSDSNKPAESLCPNCASAMGPSSPQGLAQCPHCGQQFLIMSPDPEPAFHLSASETQQFQNQEELNALHIQNISTLRRGAYRGRSYLIIAAGVCVVAAAKLIQIAVVA